MRRMQSFSAIDADSFIGMVITPAIEAPVIFTPLALGLKSDSGHGSPATVAEFPGGGLVFLKAEFTFYSHFTSFPCS